VFCALLLTACNPAAEQSGIKVRVIVDGRERAYVQPQPISVGQFLQKQNIVVNDFDKVYPPLLSPLSDNVTITIVRVTENDDCTEDDVPYATLTRKTDELPPGEKRVIQAGINGRKRVCAKVTREDGVEKSRLPGNTTIIAQPRDEIIAVGIDNKALDPVLINGLVAYISGGQGRIIENNSVNQRTLPTGPGLDGRVFTLAPGGRQLLYTRSAAAVSAGATPIPGATPGLNALFIILDVQDKNATPVKLIDDVLYADWIPGRPNTFGYSTGRWSDTYPDNHEAFNDYIIATLDPKTGKISKAQKLVSSGLNGLYASWGTQFRWSPDGRSLAWAQPDGVGTVDTKTGKISKLLDFKVYSATLARGWLWVPGLSWAPSGDLLAATIHGAPEGSEQPDASPIFDLRLVPGAGGFEANLAPRAGMWARPQFSPLRDPQSGDASLAFLRARDSVNSLNSEYDVVVADRDGSNGMVVFPGPDKPGLRPVDDFSSELVWSADGNQLLCTYQGNLWLIDTRSKRSVQLTVVDDAHQARWSR
jgi:hypothetical protein